MDRPTVSIHHAAALVGVHRRTIYNWMKAGKVTYVRTAGGAPRIVTETLWRSGNSPADAGTDTAIIANAGR